MSELCPCQSQQPYNQCCEPYHLAQKFPPNAELLMRSRYCAYVKSNIAYIVETTVPTQQSQLDQAAMKEWSVSTKWSGLEILRHLPKVAKHHAQVEFKAFYQADESIQFHQELSTFVQIEGRWYFLDPTVDKFPSMKQPCVCGSGIKFKACCGKFL